MTHLPQGGLELGDVLAVAHARLEGAPGGHAPPEQVGGLVPHLVQALPGVDDGAGGRQLGDDALEAGAHRVGVGEAQGPLGTGLALQVPAGDLPGGAGEAGRLLLFLVPRGQGGGFEENGASAAWPRKPPRRASRNLIQACKFDLSFFKFGGFADKFENLIKP